MSKQLSMDYEELMKRAMSKPGIAEVMKAVEEYQRINAAAGPYLAAQRRSIPVATSSTP